MTEVDYSKLRGRIVEKYGSCAKFAQYQGVTKVSVSNKLCSKKGFSHGTILKWSDLLDIPLEEIGTYFFTIKVQ